MKNLRDVPVGGKAVVKKLEGQGPTKKRIMDMGITKGAVSYTHLTLPTTPYV